jgi:diguanylate cyclase (GGDEF)-like protein/PAS domain S-box-containing protein
LREVEITVDHAPVGIVHVRRDGTISLVNRAVVDFVGGDQRPRTFADLIAAVHPDDRPSITALIDGVLAGRASAALARGHHQGREWRQVKVLATPVVDDHGRLAGGAVTLQDVHDELLLTQALQQFRALAETTSDLIGVASVGGDTDYLNPAAQRFFGVDTISLADVTRFVARHHHVRLLEQVPVAVERDGVWSGELDIVDRHGAIRPFSTVITGLRDDDGAVTSYVVSYRDLADRKRLEDSLTHQAGHDALTGLPNRQRLFETLADAVDAGEGVTVLFGDLDGFKLINDSVGHAAGDAVLVEIARRLAESARAGDLVARLGGDEFVVACRGPVTSHEAIVVAERFIDAASEPIHHAGRDHVVSMSIGIAQFDPSTAQGTTASELVQQADLAMYDAKLRGRSRITVFDEVMRARAANRIELESDLREAVHAGAIELRYQPVVHTTTGEVVGFEALARWHRPRRGLVFPKDFIHAIDEAGLAAPFAEHCIREAVHSVMMMRLVQPSVTVSVNLSASQILEPALVDVVATELRHARVPAEALTIEITEEIVMEQLVTARPRLEDLRALGVRFAIDDFGTGYSNIAMLREFTADYVKVDRSLVHGNRELLRLVLGLTSELGFAAIGEGVESRRQADDLAALGCHLGQGYYFSPPMTTAEAIAFLGDRPAHAGV